MKTLFYSFFFWELDGLGLMLPFIVTVLCMVAITLDHIDDQRAQKKQTEKKEGE